MFAVFLFLPNDFPDGNNTVVYVKLCRMTLKKWQAAGDLLKQLLLCVSVQVWIMMACIASVATCLKSRSLDMLSTKVSISFLYPIVCVGVHLYHAV